MPEKNITPLSEEELKRLEEMETQYHEHQAAGESLPPGYIPITLSTNGCLGAPKLFHVRNFKTSDLVALSVETTETLPETLVTTLNRMIYEDVDVSDWHEKEIIELLVRIYVNFYSTILPDAAFPWDESDIEFLIKNNQEEMAESLRTEKWIPRVSIDLTTLKTNELEPGTKTHITISKPSENFSVTFRPPRFGDILVVKKFLREKYAEKESKFSPIRKRYKKDENSLTDDEYNALMEYEKERLILTADLVRSVTIEKVNFGGKEVRPKNLVEKLRVAEDPRFDVKLFQVFDESFSKLEFGIDPMITVVNPITNQVVTRRFNFRLVDILQALRVYRPDEYVVSFDN